MDAVALQRLLKADAHNPNTKPSVRALSIRTWDIIEERKRILKMKPLPKSVDVEKLKRERSADKLRKSGKLVQFQEEETPAAAEPQPAQEGTKAS